MIFRQFNNTEYVECFGMFVSKHGDFSRWRGGDNLFGWADEGFLRRYVGAFKLEIIYDKT